MAVKEHGDKLVIVADVIEEKAKALADEAKCEMTTNWEDVIARKDLDIVIVCTPNYFHAPVSIAAMRKGKHVLCEKPLARNPAEAEQMINVAEKTRMKLKCGFNLRYHPAVQQVRKWFDQGIIGEINFIRIRYGTGGRQGYDKEWRADKEMSGGGQLMDQGVHALDLSRWFLGEFSQVFAYVSTTFWKNSQVEDNAFCLLRTKQDQIAAIHASWTQWKNLFSLEIFGNKGYGIVEGLGGNYGTERAILGKKDFRKPFEDQIIEFRKEDISWLSEWKEFVSATEENREPMGNAFDGLQAVRLAHALYESASKAQAVNLHSFCDISM
jgi:predicted dehydrogenase